MDSWSQLLIAQAWASAPISHLGMMRLSLEWVRITYKIILCDNVKKQLVLLIQLTGFVHSSLRFNLTNSKTLSHVAPPRHSHCEIITVRWGDLYCSDRLWIQTKGLLSFRYTRCDPCCAKHNGNKWVLDDNSAKSLPLLMDFERRYVTMTIQYFQQHSLMFCLPKTKELAVGTKSQEMTAVG